MSARLFARQNVRYARCRTLEPSRSQPPVTAVSEHGVWRLVTYRACVDVMGWRTPAGLLFVDRKDVQRGLGL